MTQPRHNVLDFFGSRLPNLNSCIHVCYQPHFFGPPKGEIMIPMTHRSAPYQDHPAACGELFQSEGY